MALILKLVGVIAVPVGLPHKAEHRLSVRGLSRSRLIAADVDYRPGNVTVFVTR